MNYRAQIEELKKIIQSYSSLAVTVSGGTDSTLLAAVASEVLPQNRLILMHARLPFSPEHETQFIIGWAAEKGLRLLEMPIDILGDSEVSKNSSRRCYFCKHRIMSAVIEAAKNNFDIETVADGTIVDDFGDYRPGLEATSELGIKHPLAQAGFTKRTTRLAARAYKLPNWRLPASACLASRIPSGMPITTRLLRMIAQGEKILLEAGFSGARLRALTPTTACIEVIPIHLTTLFRKRKNISEHLKRLGFNKILMDLNGYTKGGMNNTHLAIEREKQV